MKRALGLGLLLLACDDDGPTVDQVITVEVCPSDVQAVNGCKASPVADGSTTTVRVCAPLDKERRSDLTATLRTHAGKWMTPSDSTVSKVQQVELGASRCKDADLQLPTSPGVFEIEAELEGYTDTAWVTAMPAPVELATLSATPQLLQAGTSNALALRLMARATLGRMPSDGTQFRIEIVTTPLNQFGIVTPASGYLVNGEAQFTLNTGPMVTSVRVTVAVIPPKLDGLESPPSATTELTISVPGT